MREVDCVKEKYYKIRKGSFLSQLRSPNSGETRGVLFLPGSRLGSISTSPTSPNALQTLVHSPCPLAVAAMPDLSTGYLPPFPELSLDAGALAVEHAGEAAAAASADAAPAYTSSSASVGGGGGGLIIPAECRWRGRVRTFDTAGPGDVTACPAARRSGGKELSLIPSPEPARTQASASAPTLEERVSEWAAKKAAAGVPAHHCVLPFLTGAPRAVRILVRSASR